MTTHTPINGTELRIIGMSRSGNHAIINWLMNQMATHGKSVFWLNCAEPMLNPYESARPLEGDRVHKAIGSFDLAQERAGHFTPKDWFLFNYEDTFLKNACSDLYETHHDEWVGTSGRRHDVLILRDPFNLFASRQRLLHHTVAPPIGLRIWKQHARQFATRPRMLRHNPVLILYNRWCSDPEYREDICHKLDVPFTDAGREAVLGVGGGSSFDGLKFNGKASDMSTDERWRHYLDDADYVNLFDEQTMSLATRLFGHLPAMDEIRRRQSTTTRRLLRKGA